MSAPILVGTAEHYAQFIKLCRARVHELGITFDTCDAVCGFPARYTAKLLCEQKAMSVYSLFTLARALALLPSFHHDEPQLAQLRSRIDWEPLRRAGAQFRGKRGSGAVRFNNYIDFYRQIGRKGAERRSMLLKQRRAQTAKARAARWGGK